MTNQAEELKVRRLRSTYILIGLSLVWTVIAAVAAIHYWRTVSKTRPVANSTTVEQVLRDFKARYKAVHSLVITAKIRKSLQGDLYDPTKMFAATTPPAPATLRKQKLWSDFQAGRLKTLPSEVWKTPPLIHPSGGTWARFLFTQRFGDTVWLKGQTPFLHVLEKRPFGDIDDVTTVLSHFTPEELTRYYAGDPVIVSDTFVVIAGDSTAEADQVQAFARADWNKFIADSPLQVAAPSAKVCDYRDRSYCWFVRADLRQEDLHLNFFGLMGAVVALIFSVIAALWMKTRGEERSYGHQQLVMQTLAHDLRHPLLGLKMALEVFNNQYKNLPEAAKKEVAHLDSIAVRMDRLVNVSREYLKLLAEDDQYAVQAQRFTSVNALVGGIVEPYKGKVIFSAMDIDCGCVVDSYWLSTCILNLVKNAFIHGTSPIEVRVRRGGNDLWFTVQDGGPGPSVPIDQLVHPKIKDALEGNMSLGLSLVNRVAGLMGATLSLDTKPTRFAIHLPNSCFEQERAAS